MFCRVVMWPQPARVLVDEVAEQVELLRRDRTRRELDPDHLVRAALALTVDPVVQPHDTEDVLGDLTGEVGGDGALEPLDVAQLLGVKVSREQG